jgi:hypothetical protein
MINEPIDIDAIKARMANPYGYLDAGEMRDDVIALIAEVEKANSTIKRMETERVDVDAELEECEERNNQLLADARRRKTIGVVDEQA